MREQFLAGVRQAAEGTPYVVTPTEAGFDVALDVADAQWYGLLNKAGLKKAYTHHVAVADDGTYAVTDDSRTVEWVAGVPRLSASAERTRGRSYELSFQKSWALNEQGKPAKVVDYSFSSEKGRKLITGVADELGLRQRRGTEEKVGIAFALVGGVGALLTLVVLGVLALMGKL
ncbi:hypothetical protein ACT8ZV_14425 [Nocardioides sp. MAHUQ-72]|uniref:hypothetical protein n=1 Tax=unclassified Nocardioides TaxID=2615069 RepID=UPI00361F5FFB